LRRGDVCWVALDPVLGTEIKKTRPAIIVSNDAMNRYSQRVVVMPITFDPAALPAAIPDNESSITTHCWGGNFKACATFK